MFTKRNVQEYVDSIIKGRLRTDASLWRQDNVLIFTFGGLPSSFSRLTDPRCKLEIESSREGRCSPWIANQRIILVKPTFPRKLIVDIFFCSTDTGNLCFEACSRGREYMQPMDGYCCWVTLCEWLMMGETHCYYYCQLWRRLLCL